MQRSRPCNPQGSMDLQETHMLGHMRNSDGQELISQQALKSLGSTDLGWDLRPQINKYQATYPVISSRVQQATSKGLTAGALGHILSDIRGSSLGMQAPGPQMGPMQPGGSLGMQAPGPQMGPMQPGSSLGMQAPGPQMGPMQPGSSLGMQAPGPQMGPSPLGLDQLNLPSAQQVGLLVDIMKALPDPSKHPKFLKQRRSQSRPTTLSDFCRPVQTPAEHSLFMHCHMLHTNPKSKRTDWLGMAYEFNLAVSRTWQQTHVLSDTFLKHESHLKQYEK